MLRPCLHSCLHVWLVGLRVLSRKHVKKKEIQYFIKAFTPHALMSLHSSTRCVRVCVCSRNHQSSVRVLCVPAYTFPPSFLLQSYTCYALLTPSTCLRLKPLLPLSPAPFLHKSRSLPHPSCLIFGHLATMNFLSFPAHRQIASHIIKVGLITFNELVVHPLCPIHPFPLMPCIIICERPTVFHLFNENIQLRMSSSSIHHARGVRKYEKLVNS